MVAKIENGDYMLREHKLIEANYYDALVQSARMLMLLPREKYYPDKNFGERTVTIDFENDLQ